MAYDPDNARERKSESNFPKDAILDGVITNINDGKVKDFVQNTEKWKDKNQPAIEVCVEVMVNNKPKTHKQVFTYDEDDKGMVYGTKSNMGKFKAKYNTLPKVSTKVKIVTNSDGYPSIKLD